MPTAKTNEDILDKRKEKVKAWLKNPYNIILIVIFLSAIVIRLHYYSLTNTQPLWWDESEYGLRAKAFAFGTPITGWAPEREILAPLIFALILKIGGTEVTLKFVQIIISCLTILMTYLLFARLSSKRTALITTFLMSFFWLHIFFSERLLIYLWAPLCYLVIVYFFYTGYIQDKKRDLYLFAIASGIGLVTYFSVGFLLFGLFIYILTTEKMSFLKNKKVWKSFAVFILTLLPFMIYFQINYGFPLPRFAVGFSAATTQVGAGLSGIFAYINMFPSRIGWWFTIIPALGILYFLFMLLLGWGIKDNLKRNANNWLIFICFFIPLFLYTFYGVVGGNATFYDAFILPVFPFFFAFSGLFFDKLENATRKWGVLFILILLIALAGHAYFGITGADTTIKNKISSYDSVKYAGFWLKDNTLPNESVISASLPQITYYSERNTYSYQSNLSQFLEVFNRVKPVYITDSIWENVQPWIHQFIAEHNASFTPVQVYFLDSARTQPSMIIYKVENFSL